MIKAVKTYLLNCDVCSRIKVNEESSFLDTFCANRVKDLPK